MLRRRLRGHIKELLSVVISVTTPPQRAVNKIQHVAAVSTYLHSSRRLQETSPDAPDLDRLVICCRVYLPLRTSEHTNCRPRFITHEASAHLNLNQDKNLPASFCWRTTMRHLRNIQPLQPHKVPDAFNLKEQSCATTFVSLVCDSNRRKTIFAKI